VFDGGHGGNSCGGKFGALRGSTWRTFEPEQARPAARASERMIASAEQMILDGARIGRINHLFVGLQRGVSPDRPEHLPSVRRQGTAYRSGWSDSALPKRSINVTAPVCAVAW